MQITESGSQPADGVADIRSPAKINLFLHVTGKRPDGFHELYTLMCCIDLFDHIRLYFEQQKAGIVCDHPAVPADETNTAFRAAELFHARVGEPNRTLISIRKNIPVGAGLGGGSGNAAAVLKALNARYGFPLDDGELAAIGLAIGADVPFMLYGKPAIATGVGENLQPCPGLASRAVLLLNPGFTVSTAMVYKNLNLGLTKCEKKTTSFPFKEPSVNVAEYLCNDLETVTISMFPELEDMKALLLETGAEGALMSGSGPTVFGLFSDRNKAEQAGRRIKRFGPGKKFVAELIVE